MRRNTKLLRAGFLVALGALALSGCRDREERAYGTPRPVSPPDDSRSEPPKLEEARPGVPVAPLAQGAIPFADMKGKLADAKCQRAVRCDQIGKDKEWPSKDACVAETRAEEFPGLVAAQECPQGVDSNSVDKCVKDILEVKCGDALAQACKYVLCVGEIEK